MPIRKAASVDSQFMRSEGKRLIEIFFAEFTGTGILILLGCMSQIVWSESEAVHAWQGSVVFAVVVTTVIQVSNVVIPLLIITFSNGSFPPKH